MLSCNVNGLRDFKVRQAIKSRFLYPQGSAGKPDVFMFQESHSTPENVKQWEADFGGKLIFSHGENLSWGVLLGFRPGLDVKVISSVQDTEGRYIVANVSIQGEGVTIGNIYMEPGLTTERVASLLQEITGIAQTFDNTRVIFGGDFNAVLDPTRDCNAVNTSGVRRGRHLQNAMDQYDLTDVFRVLHPTDRRYSCVSFGKVLSRLDYTLVSPDMLTYVVEASIGAAYKSDHSPIYLYFNLQDNQPGKGIWHFPNYLLGDPVYKQVAHATIKEIVDKNPDADPVILWETIKASVRGDTIRYLSQRKREKKQKIEELEAEVANAIVYRDRFAKYPDLMKHYSAKVAFLTVELEDVYEAQNAIAKSFYSGRKYYQWGHSMKYYFRLPGKKHDSIKQLRTPQGYIVHDSDQILKEGKIFYDKLYTQEAPVLQKDPELNQMFLRFIPVERMSYQGYKELDRPITLDDLYDSLSAMQVDKVSGPDSLSVEFYRAFWPVLGKLMHASFLHSQARGSLSDSQRRGILRLIPKRNKDLFNIANWRPITLLNVDYKILSKALAKRLASILPDLIHQDQKGFIRGRYIGDNIMDLYSLLSQVQEEKEEAWLLLLDIHKAFDSVSWSFLRKVLDTFMFLDSFIHWIELLYRDKEIRLSNNGHISDPIRPTRGLAQGDGLSPLLFVLVIETLALTIRENVDIKGIQYGTTQKKIGLLADDAILALKNSQLSFSTLLQTLEYFTTVSNLLVNREKSVIIPIGKNPHRNKLDSMEDFLYQTDGYINYLGIATPVTPPPAWDRSQRSLSDPNYTNIINYIRNALAPRNDIRHTILGRILNTKAFVASKLNYTFSLSPSPLPQLLTKIQSLLNGYIWSQGRHYISAALMYQPWDTGGMDMYSCRFQEHALKLKWLNRLLTGQDEFWCYQISRCFVLPIAQVVQFNCKFTDLCGLLRKKAKLPPFWMDVFKIWYHYHYEKKPRDPGSKLLMFNSAITTRCVHSVIRLKGYNRLNIFTVRDFVDLIHLATPKEYKDLGARFINRSIPHQWLEQLADESLVNNELSASWKLTLTTTQTVQVIQQNIVSHHPVLPSRIWDQWQSDLEIEDLQPFWKSVMAHRLHITEIKLRSFYVRFVNRAYCTNVDLHKWGKVPTEMCTFCGNNLETRVHLFWDCAKVRPIWTELITFCKTYITQDELYTRNSFLLLGFGTPVLNLLSTLCKYHIHTCRLFGGILGFQTLINKIRYVKSLDAKCTKFIAHRNMGQYKIFWKGLAEVDLKDD